MGIIFIKLLIDITQLLLDLFIIYKKSRDLRLDMVITCNLSPSAGLLGYCCGRFSLLDTCLIPARPIRKCWSL